MAGQSNPRMEQAGSSPRSPFRNIQRPGKGVMGSNNTRSESATVQPSHARRRLFSSPYAANFVSPVDERQGSQNSHSALKKGRMEAVEASLRALRAQERNLNELLLDLRSEENPATTIRDFEGTTPHDRSKQRRSRSPSGHRKNLAIRGLHRQESARPSSHRDDHSYSNRREHPSCLNDKRQAQSQSQGSGTRRHGDKRRRSPPRDVRRPRSFMGESGMVPIPDPGTRSELNPLPVPEVNPLPVRQASDPALLKIAELEQKIADMQAGMQAGVKPLNLRSPFSAAIDLEKADPKVKLPILESYDGAGDPYDHTHHFEMVMGYYNFSDARMCKVFITTLTKVARQWIVSMPPGSIGSWRDLTDKFHDRFGSNKRRSKLTASLMQIKQRGNESLGQYVERFRLAVGSISDLNMIQALGFFTAGLDVVKSRKLLKDFMFKPLKDLSETYGKAERLVAIDEAMSTLTPTPKHADHPKASGSAPRSAVWDRIGPKASNQQANKSSADRNSFRSGQDGGPYTELNTNIVHILNDVKGHPFFETPGPCGAGNPSQYCNYHQSTGITQADVRL